MDNITSIQQQIEQAWQDRSLLQQKPTQDAIRHIIEMLDKGAIRIAEPRNDGWKINEWIKKAVILYFPIQQMHTIELGPFEFYDKIPLKRNYKELSQDSKENTWNYNKQKYNISAAF